MSGTRQRGPNYTNDEKIILLNIIAEFKHIIECKKTDSYTWKDKEKAWLEVTNKFNAICPNLVKRDKQSIKKFYENKKKDVRKAVAVNKIEMLKTGGGSLLTDTEDPTQDLLLNIVNQKTVCGFNNKFDGDQHDYIEGNCSNDLKTNYCDDFIEPSDANSPEVEEVDLINEDKNNGQESVVTQNNDINKTDWGNYKPADLKKPISKKIAERKGSNTWNERRRPTLALHSSHLSKQYGDLASVKLELAILQRDAFIAENKAKMERDQIEFELKKKSIELDIEMKQLQLKKMNFN